MRLTNGHVTLLNKALYVCTSSISIVTLLQIVFIGKNLTFSTRFTPLQSQQNNLRNQSYITEAQALIIFICIIYLPLLSTATYSSVKHQKKGFIPILISTLGVSGILILFNIYFLTGASIYREFMNQQYQQLKTSEVCKSERTTLCIVGNCYRTYVYEEAKSMSIAFTVLNIIFSIGFALTSIIVNKNRKSSQKMELIV